MTHGWRLERGATLHGNGTAFRVWASHAKRVDLVLYDDDGGRTTHALREGDGGEFLTDLPGVRAGARYAYSLDGGPERADPISRWQPDGVHGPSAVVDPAFPWTDDGWTGLDPEALVVYELHVGTFTRDGTFEAAIAHLPELVDLGVTAIELMPVAEFPGRRGWGYDGVHAYAPHSAYGGPTGLKRLVDAAHAHGLGVFLDVVYNHLGPDGNHLDEFGPYFTDHYHTPWGRAINYDGAGSDDVRRWAIDNALHWIVEYHIDGLRLDAVQEIYDMTAIHLLQELAERAHEAAAHLGRRALVVAESALNDPRLVRPAECGGLGLDAQWNDEFHHAVHARITGERDGYYCDFGSTAHIEKALRDRFVLDGVYSCNWQRRHGAPAADVPAHRFVVAIQTHDQAGNRARGDRLSTLVEPPVLRLATGLLLLSPYAPLIFMGEEYGESNPFLYFVSHTDPELIEAVRSGRRREFAAFAWTGELPDPQAIETYERSRLSRDLDVPGRRQLRSLYRALLRLRAEHAGLRPAAPAGVRGGREWIVLQRGDDWLVIFRFDGDDEPPEVPAGPWTLVLSTDEPRFGGSGGTPPVLTGGRAGVPINTAALYRRGEP